MTKKGMWIVIAVLAVILLCAGSIYVGKFALDFYNDMNALRNPAPLAVPEVQAPPVEAPAVICQPAVEKPVAPVAVCDPSTVAFEDKGELDPNIVTTIEGPAIYEWWTGGSNEGVQRVGEGSVITIHGVAGHWWVLPSQAGLDCAWDLHVQNYGAKPQHEGKTYDMLVVPPPAKYLK